MAKGSSPRRTKKKTGEFSFEKIFLRRSVLIFFLCAAAIAGGAFGLRHFFLNSGFFTVKEIMVNRDRSYSFREGEEKIKKLYIGKNIFSLDLLKMQRSIEKNFPQLQKVEVRRNLPDRIEVDIVSREPIAVIDTAGGIVIDREGVVLAAGVEDKDCVKIKGIRFFINAPSKGRRIRSRALNRALALLQELRRKLGRDAKDVEYIDISDRNNTLLGICGITVKMGTHDLPKKIDELKEILDDPDINIKGINYIDLRFEKAVISPK
jgi:cell division septal protein FtsQ